MVAVLFLMCVAVWLYIAWASSAAVQIHDRLVAYAGHPGAVSMLRGGGSAIFRALASLRGRSRRGRARAGQGWQYSPAEMAAAGVDPARVDASRYGAAVVGLLGGVLLGVVAGDPAVGFLLGGVCGAAGMMLVRIRVRGMLEARRRKILREFPDVLELLSVAMNAGLSFDRAIQTMVMGSSGPTSQLFRAYLDDVAVGKPPSQALLDLAERSGVQEVREFATHAVQSRRYGMGLGEILRAQSDHMRRVLRSRQREQVGKASVQMLIPLILCIFPVTFLLTVSPVIIRVLRSGVFGQ
jgi:pilus assembly protein TadC